MQSQAIKRIENFSLSELQVSKKLLKRKTGFLVLLLVIIIILRIFITQKYHNYILILFLLLFIPILYINSKAYFYICRELIKKG